MISSYSVQSSVVRPTRGFQNRKLDPRIESLCSHLKILANLSEFCWRCLIMIVSYSV